MHPSVLSSLAAPHSIALQCGSGHPAVAVMQKMSRQEEEHRADHSHADQLDGDEDERCEQNHAVFPHGSNQFITCLLAVLKFAPTLLIARVVIRSHVVLCIVIIPFIAFRLVIGCSLII